MPLIIGLIILAVLVFGYFTLYNGIVRARNRVDNAWQTIDAQLQRRSDLIPNLVNTVKGYAAHEKEVFDAVTTARAAMNTATTPEAKMEANEQLSGVLTRLFAVAEAYPELKANANFQQLQADLTDTENRIVYARQSFNDCVLNYNNAIQTFPGSLVAGVAGFTPLGGFQAAEGAREVPNVEF